jgi:hypothetical protein
MPDVELLVCSVVSSCSIGLGGAKRDRASIDAKAAGGVLGRSEARRMVAEKVLALAEAQTATAMVAMKGGNGQDVARKVLRVYKKRVGGNRRRLSK